MQANQSQSKASAATTAQKFDGATDALIFQKPNGRYTWRSHGCKTALSFFTFNAACADARRMIGDFWQRHNGRNIQVQTVFMGQRSAY